MNIIKNIQTQLKNFFTIDGNYLDAKQRSISLTDFDGTEQINQSDEINSGYKTLTTADTQTFTPSINGYITSVSLYFDQASVVGDTLTVSIKDMSDVLLTQVLYTSVPTGAQWIKKTLNAPAFLKAGTQYKMVLSPNASGPFVIAYDATGSYAGGSMQSNPAQDYDFRIYMEDVGVVVFPTSEITGVTQDIVNNISETIVPSSQGTLGYVTNFFLENTPIFSNESNNSPSDTWFGFGYLDFTNRNYWEITLEAKAINITTCETAHVRFTIGWNNSNTLTQTYRILSGNISGIRPNFRIYTTPSHDKLYPFVRIFSGTVAAISINRYITYPNASNAQTTLYLSYAGTSTSPTGMGSNTQRYDTRTDDAGLYAPKNVTISGPFTDQTINIYFSVNGDQCSMTLSQMITTGNSGTAAITAPAGTIPDNLLPYGYSISNMPQDCIKVNESGTISYGSLNINTSLNGGFTIYASPAGASFNPGTSAVGFYNKTITWTIKNS